MRSERSSHTSHPLPPLLAAAALARDGQREQALQIVQTYMQRHPDYRAADVEKLMRSPEPHYAEGRTRLIETLRELGMP